MPTMVLITAGELDAWIRIAKAKQPGDNKYFFRTEVLLGALLELKALRAEITKNAAILTLAKTVGQHWRDQEGCNGALLDELASITKDVP